MPLAAFFREPTAGRRVENELGDDELLVAVPLPASARGGRGTYLKAMNCKVWSFALVSVAAALCVDAGRIADARLVLGGVAPIPHRAEAVEQLLIGSDVGAATFERVAECALEGATPLRQNSYKIALAQALIVRALATLTATPESLAAD